MFSTVNKKNEKKENLFMRMKKSEEKILLW